MATVASQWDERLAALKRLAEERDAASEHGA
jgi:hypothetical protein